MATLLQTLRARLRELADPERAPQMQAYMKSDLPYHGVAMPIMRRAVREILKPMSWEDTAAWQRDVRAVWHGAKFREERYAALEICGHRRAKAFRTFEALGLYEDLVVTGAWWDLVDPVAVHLVGPLLRLDPKRTRPVLLDWSVSPDLWKRRTSIICQVLAKDATDVELLYACVEPSLASREFFLRKAIGWALRSYSAVNADAVVSYVDEHVEELSGLSRREALKNVK